MKRLLLAIVFTVGMTAPALTDFKAGISAHDSGAYATALREFKRLAAKGHAGAQLMLGYMYRDGQGVPQNNTEAAKWLRKAAEQGYAGAQFVLGGMYSEGHGVPQNYTEAVKWYRKAAEQGYAL